MQRLGYDRYVAQGGDWGNAVTEQLALLKPDGLLGIHTNMPATLSPEISKGVRSGAPVPAGLSADEKKAYEILVHFFTTGDRLRGEMGTGPRRCTRSTIRRSGWRPGCSITTSPATS